MSKSYLITGTNAGIGLEASRILAARDDTKTIYMTARSQPKVEAAMQKLGEQGIPKEKLVYVHFDGADGKSAIEQDVETYLPKGVVLNGVVLNAGGMGSKASGEPTEPNGVTDIAQSNLVAHCHLVDALLATGRIGKGTRLIYAGSEGARGLPAFGMAKPEYGESVSFYKDALTGKSHEKFDLGMAYTEIKGIAALYFAAWNRKIAPDVFVLTVSPGATSGSSISKQGAIPWWQGYFFSVMIFLNEHIFGTAHSLSVGAQRYVDAVTGEGGYDAYSAGAFVASEKGASGRVVDQATLPEGKDFADVTKQNAAFEAVRSVL